MTATDPATDDAAAVGTDAADAAGIHRFHDEERRPHHDPRDATDIDLDAVLQRRRAAGA